MSYLWFTAGFLLGLFIGAGAVLMYINRKFTNSMKRFEEEMDLLEDLEEKNEE